MKQLFFSIIIISQLHSEIIVLSSKDCLVNSISQQELKYLFLNKKNVINSQTITPLNNTDDELYEEFCKTHLNKSLNKMNTYWARMLFTGRKQPPKNVDFSKEYNDKCYMTYSNNAKNGWREIIVSK